MFESHVMMHRQDEIFASIKQSKLIHYNVLCETLAKIKEKYE